MSRAGRSKSGSIRSTTSASRLCALDENLRQIESALDVTIARRGAKFTVKGEQAQRAAQAIEHFYDRAAGELTLEDVQLG